MADISRIFTYRRRSNFSRFHFTFRLFQPRYQIEKYAFWFFDKWCELPFGSWVSNRFLSLPLIKWSDYFLFSHSLLRDDDRPPVKFVRKSFITLRNLDGALYRSHCEAFISFWSYYIDIDEKIFTSFHVFIYLSASSRSIQPRHINIISTSFYFIFPTIHRALFPTPSSIIFIKLSQVQTHYITRRFFTSYSSLRFIPSSS